VTVELRLDLAFAVRDQNGHRLPADLLHAQGERLMEALLDLEEFNSGMKDPATDSDADGQIVVGLWVSADSDDAAVAQALHLCRTAVHAIGGSTPDWPASGLTTDAAPDFRPTKVQFDYVRA
jgi:hypothetical protein